MNGAGLIAGSGQDLPDTESAEPPTGNFGMIGEEQERSRTMPNSNTRPEKVTVKGPNGSYQSVRHKRVDTGNANTSHSAQTAAGLHVDPTTALQADDATPTASTFEQVHVAAGQLREGDRVRAPADDGDDEYSINDVSVRNNGTIELSTERRLFTGEWAVEKQHLPPTEMVRLVGNETTAETTQEIVEADRLQAGDRIRSGFESRDADIGEDEVTITDVRTRANGWTEFTAERKLNTGEWAEETHVVVPGQTQRRVIREPAVVEPPEPAVSKRRSRDEVAQARKAIVSTIDEAEVGHTFHPSTDVAKRDWDAVADTDPRLEKKARYVDLGRAKKAAKRIYFEVVETGDSDQT